MRRHLPILLVTVGLLSGCGTVSGLLAGEADQATPVPVAATVAQANDSYFTTAQSDLRDLIAEQPRTGRARNVIIFVGDGMGVSTLTAARILQGQVAGRDGESMRTAMDQLPYSAMVRTYAHDAQVSDSAPTATALLTGIKTRNDIIGLDQTANLNDCAATEAATVTTLFEQAEDAGLATGVVSTARITHATPAAAYAHVANRDWENDGELTEAARGAGCIDIARQLIGWDHGDGFEVILGGGRAQFLPKGLPDPEDADRTGFRRDGRDLTAEWRQRHPEGTYVWNKAQFDAVPVGPNARVLGLFERDHMEFESARASDTGGEPSLTELTRKAIAILQARDTGFVLLVEAGRVDHAHHFGIARLALEEAIELDHAVQAAMQMVDLDDTLIVVTADHSHNMTIAGYPRRGNPILGAVIDVDGRTTRAGDGKPYTTLSYANGPGAHAGERHDVSEDDTTAQTYRQPALVPLGSASHGGEDVVVKASGPWAHLFRGTIEQNLIYHLIRHAMAGGETDDR